jgi:hypothetical protein
MMDGGVKMGTWLKYRRYEQRLGTLDAKKEKVLESLGIKWKNHKRWPQENTEERFDWNFDLLLAFKEQAEFEEHLRVLPYNHQESEADNLGARGWGTNVFDVSWGFSIWIGKSGWK